MVGEQEERPDQAGIPSRCRALHAHVQDLLAEELRKIDHRAVMAWERLMREEEKKEASTVRRRLAALSSLFTHLVKFGVVEINPVRDVEAAGRQPARGDDAVLLAEAGACDSGCAEPGKSS